MDGPRGKQGRPGHPGPAGLKGGKGAPGYAARPGLDGVKVNMLHDYQFVINEDLY